MRQTPAVDSSSPEALDRREIARTLRGVRRRLNAQKFLRNAGVDLLVSLGFFAAFLLLDRLVLPGVATPVLFATCMAVSLSVSLLRTLVVGPLGLFDAAVEVDRRVALKERISSAVYFEDTVDGARDGDGRASLGRLLSREAAASLKELDIPRLFPLHLSRHYHWVPVLLLVCGGIALWVPSYDFFGLARPAEASELQAAVEEEKKELDRRLTELQKEAAEAKAEETKKLLALLSQEQMKPREKKPEGNTSQSKGAASNKANPQRQAMVELSRREDALSKGARAKRFDRLKQALKQTKQLSMKDPTLLRKLRQALKAGKFDDAKDELGKLREELDKLAKKKPSELTKAEKKKLEELKEALARLAKDTGALQKLSSGLSGAASGLAGGNMSAALDGMELSLEDLGELAGLQSDMDLLNQAIEMVRTAKMEMGQMCPDCGSKPGQQPGGT